MAIDYVLAALPKPVTAGFAALGALWLGRKIISYVALLLDIFILRGTDVSMSLSQTFLSKRSIQQDGVGI